MSEKRFIRKGIIISDIQNGTAYLLESASDCNRLLDLLNEQQATIDHLKRELEEYKENWDDMVELATKTSRRNVELDEQIGQLQRENEMLKKEIGRLNGLLFGTPKEAIE